MALSVLGRLGMLRAVLCLQTKTKSHFLFYALSREVVGSSQQHSLEPASENKSELELSQEQVFSLSAIDSWFQMRFPALLLVKSRKHRDVGTQGMDPEGYSLKTARGNYTSIAPQNSSFMQLMGMALELHLKGNGPGV